MDPTIDPTKEPVLSVLLLFLEEAAAVELVAAGEVEVERGRVASFWAAFFVVVVGVLQLPLPLLPAVGSEYVAAE